MGEVLIQVWLKSILRKSDYKLFHKHEKVCDENESRNKKND